MVKITRNWRATFKFAKRFAKSLSGGEVIGLIGEFGSGKTIFVKGLAKGLGIKRELQSPSFILLKEYSNSLKLFHIDLFRVDSSVFFDLDLPELIESKSILVIEWADKILNFLKEKKGIIIKFEILDKNKRKIEILRGKEHLTNFLHFLL